MRMDKRIMQAIIERFSERPDITEAEAMAIVRKFSAKPNKRKLVEQYYKRIVNRMMTKFRDEAKVRDVFADRRKNEETVYVYVPESKNPERLKSIRKRLLKNQRGLHNAIKKVKRREKVVAGQFSLDFGEDKDGTNN